LVTFCAQISSRYCSEGRGQVLFICCIYFCALP
jgi:hypothetical protein